MSLDRRQFLAGSVMGALFGARAIAAPAASAATPWFNWSGALSCRPAGRFAPATEDALVQYLANTSGHIRPVGSGHSFSPLVPTDGHIVVLDQLAGVLGHDAGRLEATLGAGSRLGDLGQPLHDIGQAMVNLPDIDRQTLAGALATGTHGTGLMLGGLPDYVTGLRLVTVNGDVLDIAPDADRDLFDAARVSLGALGIVTAVTMRNRTPCRLKATTEIVKLDAALDRFDEQAESHRHHELFPLLYSTYTMALTIDESDEPVQAAAVDPEEEQMFFDAMALVLAAPAFSRVTMVDAIVGSTEAAVEVDQSFRILTNVRNQRFNEMEYSVPREAGRACLAEILETVQARGLDVVFPLEYRYVKGDDTWLGMHTGAEALAAISIHQSADRDYRPYFDIMEPIFWKYGGRPHWGKVHSLGYRELAVLYPKFEAFCDLRRRLDPADRLQNEHLRKLFVA